MTLSNFVFSLQGKSCIIGHYSSIYSPNAHRGQIYVYGDHFQLLSTYLFVVSRVAWLSLDRLGFAGGSGVFVQVWLLCLM